MSEADSIQPRRDRYWGLPMIEPLAVNVSK